MEAALGALGGSMAASVFDCTHLVTDRVRRTVKFLCAVARGIAIVTPTWLHQVPRGRGGWGGDLGDRGGLKGLLGGVGGPWGQGTGWQGTEWM